MKLNTLSPTLGARKKRKRVGRGQGSGHGGTSGRGHKGQNARTGGKVKVGFEGGQMPMQRRLPKRGFRNKFAFKVAEINVRDLNRFNSHSIVDARSLVKEGLIKGRFDFIKILGQGELNQILTVKVSHISVEAKKKIENIGGYVEII